MTKTKIVRDLTHGSITRVLLTFALPTMMSNLLQTAYNMIDMMVVGRFVGSTGLSSVSIGGDIIHLYMFLGMGFATAGQIIVSQYVGAGRRDELNEVIGTQFTFVFTLAACLTVISLLFAPGMLSILHAPEASYAGAKAYTLCCSCGLIFIFGYNSVAAILRGMGDSRHPMIFIGLAAIINTVLDLLFIAVFSMGAFGAALATVIAQSVSFLLCMFYLYKNKEQFGFDFRLKSFRMSKRILPTVIRLGVPIALQSSAGSISALFVSSFINTYGVAASAITGIGNKLNSIALIVCNALNTSGAAIIGQNFGAGMLERVRQTFRRVFVFDLIFVSLLSIGILSFPEAVFGLFNKSPDVLALAPVYAKVAAVSFMGFAFRSPSLALVNGLGQSKMNFLMGVVEGFVLRIGLTYLLGVVLKLGLPGFWYGSVIASYGYGLVMFPYYFSGVWEKEKTVVVS